MNTLRIATRKSALALQQTNAVAKQLQKILPNVQIQLVPIITAGDQLQQKKVLAINKGLFVKELEDALLENRADIAVHSMKDMPSILPNDLMIGAICTRNSPLDALITGGYDNLETLPQGAKIGTSSLRRQAQLLAQRPDLNLSVLRGNVDTRLSKLKAGEYDAIVLAVAGLNRLGLEHHIHEIFNDNFMVPACGQGAVGIECRISDKRVQAFIKPLHDPATALCVETERQVNYGLGGSCNLPLGVYCKLDTKAQLLLHARALSSDGKIMIEDKQIGSQSEASTLAKRCIEHLIQQGADRLLNQSNGSST